MELTFGNFEETEIYLSVTKVHFELSQTNEKDQTY
jgi:hypothetical protein